MRISTFFPDQKKKRRLERRKGGGGGGRGGGGGSSGGSRGGGGSSGGGSGGSGRAVPLGASGAGGRGTATAGGFGGGSRTSIPAGQPFAGRTQGGGTRNDVYGTNTYGSGYPAGYPGAVGRGVTGAGFPFFFWPVVWGGAAGAGTAAYLHTRDYGDSRNSSRPGGPLFQAPFQSATLNTTLHVIADNATTTSLIESITSACSSNLSNTTITASQFDANATNAVKPEQAIQYYRASSVVLTLDGYNNTASLSDDPNAPPVPLPGWVDRSLLDCVNSTIGTEVPLVDAALGMNGMNGMGIFGLVGVVLAVLHVL